VIDLSGIWEQISTFFVDLWIIVSTFCIDFGTDFAHQFYLAFIKDDRYMHLVTGLQNTLIVTFFALLLGVFLGVVVALVRSSWDKTHETMRPGFGKGILRFFNALCKV